MGLINPNSLSVFNPMASQYNHLQKVEAYITGLPDSIPKIETDFLKSFTTNGTKVNAGAFGQTYINEDRTNVMKEISLQKRYDMLLKYPNSEINSIIIGELKSEIEYYHDISSLCDNVCKFLGYYYESKTLYILMENCGTDLFDIYAERPRPILEQSIRYIKQIVNALHCLHTREYAHRDLKPENITVTPEGKILLIDFGFLTKTGDTIVQGKGTPLYTSPENMVPGELSFEQLKASDIYSLGVMIMFMILPYSEYKHTLFNNIEQTEEYAKNYREEFNNSNFTKRIEILETKMPKDKKDKINFEKIKIIEECNNQLSRVFGPTITTESFFNDNHESRITISDLKRLLESPTESPRTFSLGGKSRKKKRGARRRRRTRRINKNKRN